MKPLVVARKAKFGAKGTFAIGMGARKRASWCRAVGSPFHRNLIVSKCSRRAVTKAQVLNRLCAVRVVAMLGGKASVATAALCWWVIHKGSNELGRIVVAKGKYLPMPRIFIDALSSPADLHGLYRLQLPIGNTLLSQIPDALQRSQHNEYH